MKSVIVIGGCGMLGSHIVSLLQKKLPDIKITVMDLNLIDLRDGVRYIAGDISRQSDVEGAIKQSMSDVIIHSASPVHGLGREIYERVNVQGTQNILDAARKYGIKAMVYTSSAAVVFDGSDLLNANESLPYAEKFFDAYQETKATAEKSVLKANMFSGKGIRTCAIRPAAIMGEGDRQIIPGMLRVLERGQHKFQLGDNLNLFDFTYVENCAWAHILAAQKLLEQVALPPKEELDRVDGEAFFITNGEPIYFWDFARAVWAQKGVYMRHSDIWNIPRSLAEIVGAVSEFVGWLRGQEPGLTRFRVIFSCSHRYFDIQKARYLLGYEPLVSLKEGIRRSVQWANQ